MRLSTRKTYYYTLTLHNITCFSKGYLDFVLTEINKAKIVYICKHFGIDQNGLEITPHAHLIVKSNYNLDIPYTNIITYSALLEKVKDIRDMYNYTKNGHCKYEIIYNELELYFTEKNTLNDLFNEVFQGVQRNCLDDYLIENECYLLEKYGLLWVNNRIKIISAFNSAERSKYQNIRKMVEKND